MSDKELIFQAANTFTKNLVGNLFGINTIGTDALITYVVNNMEDKYGMYLEPFLDKDGKSVKFGEADIDEFERIFKTLKANNGKHSS